MRKWIIGLSAIGLIMTSATSIAASCRDAKGKFAKCSKPAAKPARCRDTKGKFVKCTIKGAKRV